MTHTQPEHLRTALLDLLNHTDQQNRWPAPGDLAQHLDPRIRQTPALELIDAAILECLNTPDSRLIISMPPQEGKSQRAAIATPVWQLHRDPDTRIAVASYAQGLANRNGRAIRNAIVTHPDLGMAIAADNGAVSEWTLAGHDGGVLSVGRGAGITGRPVDLLIIDDPLKDRAEADSETIRNTCWDWWTDSLSTRLSPGAPVVLILTRWHEEDLAGRLLAAEDGHLWRVLNIPAQAETDDDPLGRQPGEFMVSARGRSVAQWEAIRVRVGARTWAALYQGRPSPAEGGLAKRDWWQRYATPLWEEHPDGTCWAAGFDELIISADLTFKGTANADRVAIGVWARRGAHAYLLDITVGRMEFVPTVAAFAKIAAKWPQATLKLVEDKANGPALMSMLAKRIPGIVPYDPGRIGKVQRLLAVAPLIEAGNVHIPTDSLAPWADDYIEEHAGFPNAAHDDLVDMTSQALDRLLVRPLSQLGTTVTDMDDYDDWRIGY